MRMQDLLVKAGFPAFPLGEDGFPDSGSVIRYFRERKKCIDPVSSVETHWSQEDLAKHLNVSRTTVAQMENHNHTLDSISRRRLVAKVLCIPPVLLGLGSIVDLEEFLTKEHSPLSTPAVVKSDRASDPTLYQDAFRIYADMHQRSTAQDSLNEINRWIQRIQDDLQTTNTPALKTALWDFSALSAKIYADDLCLWDAAFMKVDAAMGVANDLDDDELRAATLYRSGQIHFAMRQFSLAKTDLDSAVRFAKNVTTNLALKGAVYAADSLAWALTSKDEAGKTQALKLLDVAGSIVERGVLPAGRDITKFDRGKYYTERADALIVMGRPGKALSILVDAEDSTDPTQTRRLGYIDILRAEAHMKLKMPNHDQATNLLLSSLEASKIIKSEYNINYIIRLHNGIKKTQFRSSALDELGTSLFEWRQSKQ